MPETAVAAQEAAALARIRGWTAFFMAGLVISGATALPIPTEVEAGARLLGSDLKAGGVVPEWGAVWLRTVRDGVRATSDHAPFIFYGTDWLAFGHFAIALAFVGAWRDPVRNRWLFRFGMIICAAVPFWAIIFGPIRGIPAWWRVIDAAFGVIGFIPMWLCDRWTAALERAAGGTDPRRR
jgi:hypothetical protein